jgi:hypothetical protein
MTDTSNLALPLIEGAQAQKHVTHNEALRILDTIVQLSVLDRDLNAPPASPSEGQRWIVKASPVPTGAWTSHGNQIAAWQDSAWFFSSPKTGWIAYVVDEGALLAWNGTAWVDALALLSAWQNLSLLGVGTTADAGNPFSAKLNNMLFSAKTVAEGGNGDLRHKLSKESAAKAVSFLFQDNFFGRAEIGLTGDDDLHFKVSPDGSNWIEAITLDRTTGAARFGSQVLLNADIAPAQLTSDQSDYNPAALSGAAVLRLSSDASRAITGLQGGADGRILVLLNVGSNPIALRNESASSAAGNRFALGNDVLLGPCHAFPIIYDTASSRWRGLATEQARPSFSVHRNGVNQTGLATATFTKIQFTTKEFDTNSSFDNTANYRFMPTVAGKYQITFHVMLTILNGGKVVIAAIYKNGAAYKQGVPAPAGTPINSAGAGVSCVLDLNGTTDYVEFYCYHDHGGDDTVFGGPQQTYATGIRVGS